MQDSPSCFHFFRPNGGGGGGLGRAGYNVKGKFRLRRRSYNFSFRQGYKWILPELFNLAPTERAFEHFPFILKHVTNRKSMFFNLESNSINGIHISQR